jgi:hypothetical protein
MEQKAPGRDSAVRFCLLLVLMSVGAAVLAQQRAAPTPKPQPNQPAAVQPIPGGPPNPYLLETGQLKQRIAGLEQGLSDMQKENAIFKQAISRLQASLVKTDQQLKTHVHRLHLEAFNRGQGALAHEMFVMVPEASADKATKLTGEPVF